jgi:hypothetical protein
MTGIAQRAIDARQTRQRERRTPKYVAMAKVGNGWQRLGAAWTLRSGEDGLSIQITTIPLNWDGRFSLFVPNENTNDLPDEPTDH